MDQRESSDGLHNHDGYRHQIISGVACWTCHIHLQPPQRQLERGANQAVPPRTTLNLEQPPSQEQAAQFQLAPGVLQSSCSPPERLQNVRYSKCRSWCRARGGPKAAEFPMLASLCCFVSWCSSRVCRSQVTPNGTLPPLQLHRPTVQ